MTLLLRDDQLETRRVAAAGPLRALADSLARDLEPLVGRELWVPPEKARLTRRGGRCEIDGSMLDFEPFSPRVHRCPICGRTFDDDAHYRWWIMGYQLWLAERAVHAALLHALRGEARHAELARGILERYAASYLSYPNKDNVLGPSRLFFSTYLESIWLLQIAVALDLLEATGAGSTVAQDVRERVIAQGAQLIRGYDEGISNRQVWNNAALLAAGLLLRDSSLVSRAIESESGLVRHLTDALLPDGTWYEGENYHLFAHRGLWYGVAMAEAAGIPLDAALVRRFDEGFATPFLTALPDFTFPARRDSQYGVSLRQWRCAESAELGLARNPHDARLRYALDRLYADDIPRGDTARSSSTAEAERNVPAAALTRADLGWRSLLHALPELPPGEGKPPGSVLLAGQGYAVLRRDAGRIYVALDYGHSGAGHGHPDRLNLVLADGDTRWLDDYGTGSYVDPTLFWYRSTLAHNAPLVGGRSQERVSGRLLAYDDQGEVGWVDAAVTGIADGVKVRRALVATRDYIVDELAWRSDRDITVDLPLHVEGSLGGVDAADWQPASPGGSEEPEDGFRYLRNAERLPARTRVALHAIDGAASLATWIATDPPAEWWRAEAPGPPGRAPRRFYFVRTTGREGRAVAVWTTRDAVERVEHERDRTSVSLRDGTRHTHHRVGHEWRVAVQSADGATEIVLAGSREAEREPAPAGEASDAALGAAPLGDAGPHDADATASTPDAPPPPRKLGAQGVAYTLGEKHYRRSEQSWRDAGRPMARVSLAVREHRLLVVVKVFKTDLAFAPPREENELDNEHPDINSDGVQLYLSVPGAPGERARQYSWILVPVDDSDHVRVTPRLRATGDVALDASWSRERWGYRVEARVPLDSLSLAPGDELALDVVVNETTPDRERRRGQLALGGADGGFVYLRGDRESPSSFLRFVIDDG